MAEFRTSLSNKEDKSNKVNTISSSSTTTQYPSAKAVYTSLQGIDIEGIIYDTSNYTGHPEKNCTVNNNVLTNTVVSNINLDKEFTYLTKYALTFDYTTPNFRNGFYYGFDPSIPNGSNLNVSTDDYGISVLTDIGNTFVETYYNNSTTNLYTHTSDVLSSGTHKVKIIRNGNIADIYIDNILIYTHDNVKYNTIGLNKWGLDNNTISNVKLISKETYDSLQPIEIQENDDLNDYTEEGHYYCKLSTQLLSTLSNCPVTEGFSLSVEKNNTFDNTGVKQTLTTYYQKPKTYIRTFYTNYSNEFVSSGWLLWHEDTGWKDLTMKSGFSHYSDTEQRAEYRRIGKIVYIRGAIKVGTGFTSSGDNSNPIATISDTTCRPRYMHNCIQQGSGQNRWLMTVYSDGNICCSRYGTTSNTNVPSTAWLNLYTTYFVD